MLSWDIIAGDVKPAGHILIYDESGDHPALQAAEVAAKAGAKVEVTLTMVAPERRYHVALVDQLPAGLEPLNPALQGTPPTSHGGDVERAAGRRPPSARYRCLARLSLSCQRSTVSDNGLERRLNTEP